MSQVRTISTMRLLPSVPTAPCSASASSAWPVSPSHSLASVAVNSSDDAVAPVPAGAVVAPATAVVLDSAVDDVDASVEVLLSPVVVLVSSVVLVSPPTVDDVELSSVVELSPLAPVDVAEAVTVSADTATAPMTASHRVRDRLRSDALDAIQFPQVGERAGARPNRRCIPVPAVVDPSTLAYRRLAQSAIVQQRLPSLLDPPIGFAHRGARDRAPENTIEAFQVALALGASGLESDVWMTADGVVVLDHDGVVRGGRRRRPIVQCKAADLPEFIPTLRQLLEACGSDFHLSLDLKHEGIGPAVIELVTSVAPDLLDRLWLCAGTVGELVALRPVTPTVRLVHSTRLSRLGDGPERAAAVIAEAGIDGINLHYTDWTGGLVALFHRFERIAFGWDLQYDHVLHPAVRMGLDGVYSDHVDLMMEILAAEYIRPADLDHRKSFSPGNQRLPGELEAPAASGRTEELPLVDRPSRIDQQAGAPAEPLPPHPRRNYARNDARILSSRPGGSGSLPHLAAMICFNSACRS
jgi:glycerophosphoryl diester phosphodiesterase